MRMLARGVLLVLIGEATWWVFRGFVWCCWWLFDGAWR